MNISSEIDVHLLRARLADTEETLRALLCNEIDAVIDPRNRSPVLLSIAQQALRESEDRFRGIVETANEGIWLLTLEGQTTFANQRMADMLGERVTAMRGRSLFEFLPDSFHERAVQRLSRTPSGVPEESDSILRCSGGRELHVLVRTSATRDVSGKCDGLLAMITDMTERHNAERARRESEAEYRQIVESTTDGIIKLDSSGTIVFVNARFSEMLGYEPRELVGADVLSVVAPTERESVWAALQDRETGATAPTDTIYRHKNGSDVFVNIAGAALRDEQNRFVGVLGVVRDVTERNRLQAELIVSDRMASVGTLAAGVAHEINNPLAAAIANLDFLRESLRALQHECKTATDADWIRVHFAEPLADAQEATIRVSRIVRDLKIFSRSPTTEPTWSVDVNAVLESSLRMARNEIRHRATVTRSLRTVPMVCADEARLGQVFLNLIVNAAQAIPIGHVTQNHVLVSTERIGEHVVVEITDTGAGISPDDIGRIFDAFYTTKAIGEGTGLGLAICRRIVADMHGTLSVRSEVGVGSTFTVTLPIATVSTAEPRPTYESAHSTLRPRVLIIDDDDIVTRGVQRSLLQGCDVVCANSASDAMALFDAGDAFEVILCDLMMPNMTGIELYESLAIRNPSQAARMMFMTGGVFTSEATSFVARANIVVIEKPFGVTELRTAVHEFASFAAGSLDAKRRH